MYDTGTLLQIIFWGLYAGCIYILLATGLNLIFGVMKIVNFAHGEFLMIGAYITATIFFLTGFNPYAIILVSMLALVGIGAVVERLCFRPILGTSKLNEIFLSIGLIYIFTNSAAMIWGDEWQSIKSPYAGISVPDRITQCTAGLYYHHHYNLGHSLRTLHIFEKDKNRAGDAGNEPEPQRSNAGRHQR